MAVQEDHPVHLFDHHQEVQDRQAEVRDHHQGAHPVVQEDDKI